MEVVANSSYYAQAHPGLVTNESVTVKVMLYIMSLVSVDQKEQQMEVHGFYRTQWLDQRLAFSKRFEDCEFVTLPLTSAIWQPDIYFDNSIIEWYGAGSFSLYPQGEVFRSQRFVHRFTCPMVFTRLPFDEQVCTIKMGSYSFSMKDINVTSYDGGGVAVPSGYEGNEQFFLTQATSQVEVEVYDGTGQEVAYAYLHIRLNLLRLSDSIIWFVVVTGVCFTLVTFSGLFISRKLAPARVAMAVIPVLIMLNLETNVRDGLPPLNSSTWLTSLIGFMKAFCLCAVFEYGLVSHLLQEENVKDEKYLAFKQLAAKIKLKEQATAATSQHKDSKDEGPEVVAEDRSEAEIGQSESVPFEGQGKDILGTGAIVPILSTSTSTSKEHKEHVAEMRSRTQSTVDAESMPFLENRFAEAWTVFDLDCSGHLDQREVQVGFRRFGQYLSKGQVMFIFTELGIRNNSMTMQEFRTFFMDVEKYSPPKPIHISFWEQPPSLQVDKAFRWGYFFAMLLGACAFGVVSIFWWSD